jgi:putative ABC transport system permease protein
MEDVQEADARRTLEARIQVGPTEWQNLMLFATSDYDDMQVNKVWPHTGAWPPPERQMLVERAALPLIRAHVGDVVRIETPNEQQRELPIAGTVCDLAQLPAQIDGTPYGYVSFDTLEWFGEAHGYNELYVVAEHPDDRAHAQDVVNQVKNKAEKSGLTIPLSMWAEPGQLPLEDILQAVLMLMGVLGLLSLLLSAFLIINTVSALLAQQRRQIGVMKAIGAGTSQIMGMYLGMDLAYGLTALAIAMPLSIAGSRALSRFMAAMFNFDLADLGTPPQAIYLQIIVSLVVPALASLYPLVTNLRVTAAGAMGGYGSHKGHAAPGWLDRVLSGKNLWFARRVLLRPLLLSLRNIFRSKGRLALTLTTLTLGGATFIGVFSVRASLGRTIDDLMHMWNFDTVIAFSRHYRVERIKQQALHVPGIVETDTWLQTPTRRVRPDGSEGKTMYMFAPRADSRLAPGPAIAEGRWLLPEDENAVVVDVLALKDEPDIAVGDDIVLKIKGRERPFRVVGLSLGVVYPTAYANYSYIARITGNVGRADSALVATEAHDNVSALRVGTALEEHFDHVGLRVSAVGTMSQERSEAETALGLIISLLLIMALLLAVVGGLGLMGTMSINVLERTREVGVLRAIGAPSQSVTQVFIREGIAIGVLSWLLSALLAFPLGRALSDAVGIPIMGVPLTFSYSTIGLWLWLALVIILSWLASFLPARNASRLTVREVLAYE